MRIGLCVLAALLSLVCVGARAQPSPFDGTWNVTMTCPPHDDEEDTKGYTHHFPVQVKNGQLRGTHGEEGASGWHLLQGTIKPDGTARLQLDGIVNNPKYAIHRADRGKSYTYRVKARFEGSTGTGQRLTGRVCEFRFAR